MAARYVLGIDLGSNSVGWAALRLDEDGVPVGLLDEGEAPSLGARIFEVSVENYGQGDREQSTNVNRRQKRLQRRQMLRRMRRQRRTFVTLQAAGLLPANPAELGTQADSKARHEVLSRLDALLRARYASDLGDDPGRLPYFLRARGLDIALDPFELGRALYHLAQRRGFLSNRKSAKKKNEDEGQVKSAIRELRERLASSGHEARTLGEYFSRLPRTERLRRRWTARDMYTQEFERLWEAQVRFRPELANTEATVVDLQRACASGETHVERIERRPKLKDALHHALFFQRPLRSAANLIGTCELENGDEYLVEETGEVVRSKARRRAPICSLVHQRFRVWQRVNDLRVIVDGIEKSLTEPERVQVAAACEESKLVTWRELRQLLGLPAKARFNFQETGEKGLIGNRTNAKLTNIFGDRWRALEPSVKERLVLELWSIESNDTVMRRIASKSGDWARLEPTEGEAKKVAEEGLEPDYANLSSFAMRRLLERMERGEPFATAKKALYGELPRPATELLPPVKNLGSALRNPVVSRALSQLRTVVNAAVKRWGKPERIHVELARDLKKSKKQRSEETQRIRDREAERKKAEDKIKKQRGTNAEVTREDILRYQLAEECGWQCPYSGERFNFEQLYGGHVEIDHILPFSKSLDDSFINKTLCMREANRQKRNRTPFEAFGNDAEAWVDSEVVKRVQTFVKDHDMPRGKLQRFLATTEDEVTEFRANQLNDTRYASVLARRYLMQLYGGQLAKGIDEAGNIRILVGNGSVTSHVRSILSLNGILGAGDFKSRDDHRHHAIDAVAIALTDAKLMKAMADAAARPDRERMINGRPRLFGELATSWPRARSEVAQAMARVVTSHEVRARVRGALHQETIYSAPRDDRGRPLRESPKGWLSWEGQPYQGKPFVHVRKPIEALGPKDITAIVDDHVREAVVAALKGLGATDPSKTFGLRGGIERWPELTAHDGRKIPIRRVRIRKVTSVFDVGQRERRRFVEGDSNHHMAVFEVQTNRGPKWEFATVPLIEAARRLLAQRLLLAELKRSMPRADARTQAQRQRPIVVREKPDAKFVMALMPGEMLELNGAAGRLIYRVRGIMRDGRVQLAPVDDARLKKEMRDSKSFLELTLNSVRDRGARKVTITPLGETRRAERTFEREQR